jgi:hypothetical protein
VVSLLDGKRDISSIAEDGGMSRFEVCRVVYGLINTKMIRPHALGGSEQAVASAS